MPIVHDSTSKTTLPRPGGDLTPDERAAAAAWLKTRYPTPLDFVRAAERFVSALPRAPLAVRTFHPALAEAFVKAVARAVRSARVLSFPREGSR